MSDETSVYMNRQRRHRVVRVQSRLGGGGWGVGSGGVGVGRVCSMPREQF